MSVTEITDRFRHNIVNNQKIPSDGFCHKFGFCINSCPLRDTCTVARTKILIHCIVVNNKNRSYYPIQYANELPLIPKEIRTESTIVDYCKNDGCDNPIVFGRAFKDTYIKYAEDAGKDFKIFCSQKCMDEYEDKLLKEGYKCSKVKPK